jgi:hypothetical protein
MLDGPPLLRIEVFKVGSGRWHGMIVPSEKSDSVIPVAFARPKIDQTARESCRCQNIGFA